MSETKNWKTATFILIGVLLVMLACCVGAWFGGLAGYRFGRWSSHNIYEYEMPYVPVPEYPEVPIPELPEVPIPGEENRAYLGVAFRMVDEGALVALVVPESAAEAAGLRVGDIITEVDGRAVTEANPLDEHIGRYEPGDRVELTILRDDRERDISVRLGTSPVEAPVSPMQYEDGL